jgi:hypothetical protein
VVNADAHLRDCLPSLATRGSDRQPDLHLLRHGAVDDGEGIYVIMVLGGIVLDDVTQPGHMVVHAHHHELILDTKCWGLPEPHQGWPEKNACKLTYESTGYGRKIGACKLTYESTGSVFLHCIIK